MASGGSRRKRRGRPVDTCHRSSGHSTHGEASSTDDWSWHIDIAGVIKETLDLSVRNGVLRVQGRRQIGIGQRWRATTSERLYGRFVRVAPLPLGLGLAQLSIHIDGARLEIRARPGTAVSK